MMVLDPGSAVPWWYVYMGVNRTRREVYFGASKDPHGRVIGPHRRGGTKAIRHWNRSREEIEWTVVSRHRTQQTASRVAHGREHAKPPRGYTSIRTVGI